MAMSMATAQLHRSSGVAAASRAPARKILLLRSSEGTVLSAPTWDTRPRSEAMAPLETGVPSRVLDWVIKGWTQRELSKSSYQTRDSLDLWDDDFARRLDDEGLTQEVHAAAHQLRLKLSGARRPVPTASSTSRHGIAPVSSSRASRPSVAAAAAERAPMRKVLLLRSSEGQVLSAPTWDKRPSSEALPPLETGVPSHVLQRVVHGWTKHALATMSGEPGDSLALDIWDADTLRRLDEDGLTEEVAAAIRQLRLNGVHHGGCRPAPAVTGAAKPADAAAATASGADPVRVRCVANARVASPDRSAASRARGCLPAKEEEQSTCHHRKRPKSASSPAPAPARAPAAGSSKEVTATAQLPQAISLRARRGMPELSCKCPQLPVAASRKIV